jgi:hypothetical protein
MMDFEDMLELIPMDDFHPVHSSFKELTER